MTSHEGTDEGSEVVQELNLRIARLLTDMRPEQIVEILTTPETSLMRMANQQQQQQQQQTRRSPQEQL